MASSNYRMNVIWSSHGAQLQRDINQFLSQFQQVGNRLDQQSRKMNMWGQQMKAIGTTIRYALAGATVYAVASAVSSLGEFENKLGEIDALLARPGPGGKLQSWGSDIDRIGDMALKTSNKYGIAVDQIQQFQRSLSSSFDIPRGKQGLAIIDAWTKAMADLSLISEGADPIALGQATAALIDRPGQIQKRAPEIVSAFSHVIAQSKVIRGEDIARDVGRLSGARVAIRMTPEEVLGTYLAASGRGGSAPLIGRGIAQLLTASLVNPKTKVQQAAFQRVVGTSDPNELRKLGGMEIMRRIFAAVAPRGARIRNRRALTNIGLEDEEAIAAAGSKNIDVKTITELLGRIESTRQVLNLISVGGFPVIKHAVDGILKAERIREGSQRANIVNERRWYQQMSVAQKNIGLSITRGLEPVFRPFSSGVRHVSNLAVGHSTATVAALGGVAAAQLASRLALGVGLGGLLGKGLGRIPGVRRLGLGGTLARAPEFAAAQLIGGGVGGFQSTGMGQEGAGKRSNPLWVIIDPMSWFFPGAPAGGAPGSGTGPAAPTTLAKDLKTWGGRIGGGGVGAAALKYGGRFVKIGGIPVLVGSALAFPDSTSAGDILPPGMKPYGPGAVGYYDPRQHRRIAQFMTGARLRSGHISKGEEEMLGRFQHGQINAARFERWLRIMSHGTPLRQQATQIEGQADLKVVLAPTDELRRMLKSSTPDGMSVKLWNKGNPQSRGKNKANRRKGAD